MKLNILVIESKKRSQSMLIHFLNTYCDNVNISGSTDNIEDAIVLINSNIPDLVFLDIELSDGSGFDLLDRLKDKKFLVVFLSESIQFGIKAIKYDALDYILRPFSCSEIKSVIEKAQKRLIHYNLINNLEKVTTQNNLIPKKIALKTSTGIRVIIASKIEYIKVDDPYCRVFLNDKSSFLVQNSLKGLLPYLPDFLFRIHRSFIVNLHQIVHWDKGRGGKVETMSGATLLVSYRLKKSFVDAMKLRTKRWKKQLN